MSHFDFDYLIVFNPRYDDASLTDLFSFFSENGIRRFFFCEPFDHNCHSISQVKCRIRDIKKVIGARCPRGVRFSVCADIQMSDGISSVSALRRLLIPHTDSLFLRLPIFRFDDWINTELNSILFRHRFLPIFSCFEANLKTNPSHQLTQLIHSDPFRVCLDINYMTAPFSQPILYDLIQRNVPILPCISYSLSDYAGSITGFDQLKSEIGSPLYTKLCRNIQRAKAYILPVKKQEK